MPKMPATVKRMVRPNCKTIIPRSNSKGEDKPKDFPYANHLRGGTLPR